jgi:hypothetical protein
MIVWVLWAVIRWASMKLIASAMLKNKMNFETMDFALPGKMLHRIFSIMIFHAQTLFV